MRISSALLPKRLTRSQLSSTLDLDVMYNLGLRPIDTDNEGDSNRNRSFQMTAGLSFAVGG